MSIVSAVTKGAVKVGKAAAKSSIARELVTAGIITGVVGLADNIKPNEEQRKELEAKKAAKTAAKKAAKEAKKKYKDERKAFREQQRKTREVESALFTLQQNGVVITPEMLSGGATNQQPTIKADCQDQDLVEISPEEIEHDIKVFNEAYEQEQKTNAADTSNVLSADDILENYVNIGA